jgi:septum formation inhibitor MinC
MDEENKELGKKIVRAGMNIASGVIPLAGGLLSAASTAWSERDQDRVNAFFKQWLQMLQDEIKEKEQTIFEIAARLDMQDENVTKRLESPEYQTLLRKAFREWSAAESEEKRQYVRNVLANAAATALVSDDVIRLFLDWMKTYSELHLHVIAKIYNQNGITRGEVWKKLGKPDVREDSADADLFKLLFRDLSTGGVIRQHKETDWEGNFLKTSTKGKSHSSDRRAKSAFDESEPYELTELGKQFVHYAMTDLPLKIAAQSTAGNTDTVSTELALQDETSEQKE